MTAAASPGRPRTGRSGWSRWHIDVDLLLVAHLPVNAAQQLIPMATRMKHKSRSSGSGPTPSCAASTAVTSCAAAGATTRAPSGNCPPWPPNGTAPTAATGPAWTGHWIPRPVAPQHHAPNRRHHPPVQPRCAARPPAPKAAHGLTPYAQQPPPAPGKDPRHDYRQAHLGRAAPARHPQSPRHPLPRRHLCLAGSERRRDRPRWKFGRNPPSGKPRPGHEGGAQGRPSRSRRSAPRPPALLRGAAGSGAGGGP